uniref:DUF5131 family protein n=1 Tax=uncultured Thalassospira sp. TaxID=404382 RepID=UPI0032B1BC34
MTKIEWTQREGTKGKTWNPMRARNKKTGGVGHFCEKVSPGCKNCYAETFQKRFKNPVRYAAQDADQVEVFLDQKKLVQPIGWKKPATIFVCSQTDLFLHHYKNEWIDQVFAVMALCPQHTFIVLTKRIKTAHQYMTSIGGVDDVRLDGFRDAMVEGMAQKIYHDRTGEDPSMWLAVHFPLPNVWLGVSVEDQAAADQRIPVLLDTPAAVRFLSVEPLLGPVNIEPWIGEAICASTYQAAGENFDRCDMTGNPCDGISWCIVGGESGHNARPM